MQATLTKGPTKDALYHFAKQTAEETAQIVEGTAFHTVFGGRTGFAYDNDVSRGLLEGDVRHRIGNYLFEPDLWELFDKEQQRGIMRARCKYDLFWFATSILKYNPERPGGGVELDPTLHGELCEELVYNKAPWFIAMLFRGALKSTIISIADSLRRYLLKPHMKRLIVSDTRSIGVGILSEIKSHIELNADLIALWSERFSPAVRKTHKWAEEAITLPGNTDKRVGTFSVVGIDGNITGTHVPEIVLDDVVTDANSATPEQRQKNQKAIRLLRSILEPGGRFWVAGTRYHFEDIYADLIQQAINDRINKIHNPTPEELAELKEMGEDLANVIPADFKSLWGHRFKPNAPEITHHFHFRSIYKEDGASQWPAKFPHKEIDAIRRDQGPEVFSSQYLLQPVPESSEFKKEWVQRSLYNEPTDIPWEEIVDVVLTCDPAFTDQEVRASDYCCVMTSGITRAGHIWVIECTLAKMQAPEFLALIVDHWQRHKPSMIAVEAQAGQKGVVQLIEKAFQDRKMMATFDYVYRNRSQKHRRIRQMLQPYFSNGMVHIPRVADLLILMLRRFPSWKDDGPDALSDAVEKLRPRRRKSTGGTGRTEEPVSAVTGR